MYWTVIFKPCGGQLYAHHCVDGVYDNERKVFNTKSTDYTWQEKDVLEFTLCKILTTEEYFDYRGNKELLSEKVDTERENEELKSRVSSLEKAVKYWKESSTDWRRKCTGNKHFRVAAEAQRRLRTAKKIIEDLLNFGTLSEDDPPSQKEVYEDCWARAKQFLNEVDNDYVDWHDLRKDPTDLPEGYDKERTPNSYLVKIAYTGSLDESGLRNPDGSPATVYYYKVVWCRTKYYFDTDKGEKVVAWREIPLYEGEVDTDELPPPRTNVGRYHCPKCGTDFDTSLILCSDPPKVKCPNCNENFPIGKFGE